MLELIIDSEKGDYSNIYNAIDNIGSYKTVVLSNQDHAINEDVNISFGTTLKFLDGAKLNGTKTITFNNNKLIIHPNSEVFDTSLNLTGTLSVNKIYPQWWGFSQNNTGAKNKIALQKAIDFMAKFGGELIITDGTYKVDSNIVNNEFNKNKNCIIKGEGNVVLDYTDVLDTDQILDLGSTPSENYEILDDLNIGDNIINSNIPVECGDILQLYSTDLWCDDAQTTKREIVEVLKVDGNNIYLTRSLYDSYLKSTTVVFNCNSSKLEFSNIKIIGNNSVESYGLALRYFSNSLLDNNKLTGFNKTSIALTSCINSKIYNNNINDSTLDGFGCMPRYNCSR